METTLGEKYLRDSDNLRLVMQESAIYRVTDLIEEKMAAHNISRAQLANLMKRSRGWVTQMLDGEGNKTIRTVADALAVLGYEFKPVAERIEETAPPPSATVLNGSLVRWPEQSRQSERLIYGYDW